MPRSALISSRCNRSSLRAFHFIAMPSAMPTGLPCRTPSRAGRRFGPDSPRNDNIVAHRVQCRGRQQIAGVKIAGMARFAGDGFGDAAGFGAGRHVPAPPSFSASCRIRRDSYCTRSRMQPAHLSSRPRSSAVPRRGINARGRPIIIVTASLNRPSSASHEYRRHKLATSFTLLPDA